MRRRMRSSASYAAVAVASSLLVHVLVSLSLLLATTILLALVVKPANGFVPTHQQTTTCSTSSFRRQQRRGAIKRATRISSSTVVQLAVDGSGSNNISDDEGNEGSKDELSTSPPFSPSSSGLIDEMLSPTNEAYSRYTHLIAIPMEDNHDLMVELESVQRAVLYHCPLLINSCIVPEMTRMPLLYVDASSSSSTESSGENNGDDKDKSPEEIISAKDLLGGRDIFSIMRSGSDGAGSAGSVINGNVDGMTNDDNSISRNPITAELRSIVNDVISEQIYNSGNTNNDANEAEPILMSFHGLEMDGPANEVLSTVGTESSSGTARLRSVLAEIQNRIEARGWSTALPADEPQDGIPDGIEEGQWRPRVPFMRLPANFDESLPPPKGPDGKYGTYSAEKKASYIRQPQEGGNGISPIFWYRWWDDDFPATTVDDGGIRLREVGVYERTAPFGGTEHAFYLPHMKVELPGGDAALSKKEKSDANEAMKRMREKEVDFGDGSDFDTMDMIDGDLLSSRSSAPTLSSSEGSDKMDVGYEELDRRMMDALSEGGILWEGRDTFDKEGALNEDGTSFDTNAIDSPRFDNMADEMRVARTDAERRVLQDLYNSSPSDDTNIVDFLDAESEKVDPEMTAATPAAPLEEDYAVVAARALAANRRAENEDVSTSTDPAAAGSDTAAAEPSKTTRDNDEDRGGKTKEIVDKIRKPIATGDWSSSKPKNKIPWQDNPVFKDWQSRVTMAEEDEPTSASKPLPPFPAYEHFVGPWRMVSTPTAAFGDAMLLGDDSSRSENIILRVDGTVAGGPVLDVENMHRAAGGTWKFFEAEGATKRGEDEIGETGEEQTKLRIRLVVPPKKDRILVMEGQARQINGRIAESGKIDASSMVAPGTFGIPLAEAAKKAADDATRAREDNSSSDDTKEDILRCSGEVWVEDARTGDNRKKLGRFVLEKLRISDPRKLVYTVPKPTRIQD